jgi:hypothetical protein
MKEPQVALVIALVTILAQVPALGRAQDLDQRVPARPGGLLQVDLDMGEDFLPERLSLDIRSHDADELWAVADLSGPGGSAVTFRLEHDERGVRLYGRSGGLLAWLLGGPGVSVRVWVPREFRVDVRCRSGSVRIEDVSGPLRARVGDGSIDVRSAEGSLNLKISSGSVRVTEMLGDVAIRASKGSIDLEWVTGDVEARTGSGDIHARHMDGDIAIRTDSGEIEATELRGKTEARTERGAVYARFSGPPAGLLETYGGSVHVVLPEHAGAHLDARTRRGSVQFGAGIEAAGTRKSGQYVGAVNGGGAPLRIFTNRGSIRVDRR